MQESGRPVFFEVTSYPEGYVPPATNDIEAFLNLSGKWEIYFDDRNSPAVLTVIPHGESNISFYLTRFQAGGKEMAAMGERIGSVFDTDDWLLLNEEEIQKINEFINRNLSFQSA